MADKELFKMRSKFVENVNRELIKQLLDDLLKDGVVNRGEKNSVLEDNKNTADMARYLIDTVMGKGDEASRKMIAHLQHRDSMFYKNLSSEQKSSTTLRPTDDQPYLVTEESIRSRVALLITNIKFTHLKNRNGAEKDEQNMENLLKELGYEVVKHRDLTGKKFDDAVTEFSKHPKLKETDSVFVVIMSHGEMGAVCGVDYKKGQPDEKQDKFPIDNIYKHLGTEECPALLNKPKIIIIQACRGGNDGSVLVSDSAEAAVVCDNVEQPGLSLSAGEEDIQDDAPGRAHKEKDFISLLSCTPDTVSYRHPNKGSLLIQYIVEVFYKFWRENDIEELFRKVMRRFEDLLVRTERGQDTQMPIKDRCSLTRHFYLRPLSQA
ncbi:caspase a-like [Thunnus albacares]|uniref:caspase a-like n=1 Tax=Thunnus albacares TaxID=8236 RepID=UPI001CF67F90|nr:caspase a-like [Thunnus albacares]